MIRGFDIAAGAIVAAIVLITTLSAAQAQSASCTSLAVGQTQNITAFSVCKKVTLNSVPSPATGVAGICVPTGISAAVWQSFYDNPPPGVTIASCAVGCTANQTINWTIGGKSCTALSGAAMNHGDTRTVTDSGEPVTGTRNIECNNGSFTQSGGTCVESCAASQTVNWTISGASCSASSGAVLAHNGTRTITDSTAPATGTRNISCNNGVLSNSGGSCTMSCPGSGGYYYSLTGGCYYTDTVSTGSCDSTCTGKGLSCNASQTKDIGSDDTGNTRCATVAGALVGASVAVTQYGTGNAGCSVQNYKGGWVGGNYNGGGTTCAATGATGRVCACQSGGGGGGGGGCPGHPTGDGCGGLPAGTNGQMEATTCREFGSCTGTQYYQCNGTSWEITSTCGNPPQLY